MGKTSKTKEDGESTLTSATTAFVIVLVDQSFRLDQRWIGSSKTGLWCFAEKEHILLLWEGSPPPTFGLEKTLQALGAVRARKTRCNGIIVVVVRAVLFGTRN